MRPKKRAFFKPTEAIKQTACMCRGLVPKHGGRPSVPLPGEADWPADGDEVLALHRHVPSWRFFRHILRGHRWSPRRSQPWKSKDPSLPDAGPPRHSAVGGMTLLLLCRGHQSRWLERRRRSSASRRAAAAAAAKCLFMLIAKCTSTITLLVPGKPGLLQCPLSPHLLLYSSSWRHAKIRSGMAMTNGPSAPPLPFFTPVHCLTSRQWIDR